MVKTSADITQLQSNVSRLQTTLSRAQRDIKRKPIDEIYTATYEDGTEHKFKVYRGKAGLTAPHRVSQDPVLGDTYIDLSEPLD